MRLTLRTLLAWLDDTLSPSEVREIGKQVADSPFAKELVERVHRVTRQRRLTVPSRTGPDAVDPNVVASYLDNELPPEEVAEFEKRCLTSDVHLAEVASVHQVLSLVGQKAKVPTEARHRMYHLIKGRESVAPKAPRASQATEPEPVSEPIQPWVTPEPPRRHWLERFGPAAAVVLLILGLCWSAWLSLSPPASVSRPGRTVAVATPAAGPASQGPARPAEPQAKAAPAYGEGDRPGAVTKTGAAEPAKGEATAATAAAGESPPPSDLPPGAVAVAEKPAGVLLRHDRDARQWVPITAETPLKDQDRLLSLEPFRSTLDLGAGKVDLVGESDVVVLAPPANLAGRIELVQGRLVLHGTSPPVPYAVQVASKTLAITPPSGAVVGLERINRRDPGAPVAADPVLKVFAADGEVALAVGDARETLSGPGAITYDTGASWGDRDKVPPPTWVTEPRPTPYALQVGEQFQRYFRPNRPIVANLVEAFEDDDKAVRRLAISATRATGDIALVAPLLSRSENDVSRRAAIAALRIYLTQGPDASRQLHAQLLETFGDELGGRIEKLLVGFTAKEARDEATYTQLVDDLSSPELAVRELALDDLESLTGRDELGYNPDRPEGKGLKAWKDLLRNHELKPAAAATPEDRPAEAKTPEK